MSDIVAPEFYYKTPRKIDWLSYGACNIRVGSHGQELVLGLEKDYLEAIGKDYLADKVCYSDDWTGYDIRSYFPDGSEKYIEVKTTRKSLDEPYFMSRNELIFLADNRDKAYIYRVSVSSDGAPPRLKVYSFTEVIHASVLPCKFTIKH